MRLKTLEIKGFKSFAEETVIHFDQDVIGIVGPNGSGKSNIVDAIRWVLGEQKTRELRLDSMSSVIFNGSKKKKPAQLAQVALTFENSKNILPTEYQTVTITRILYQSGDSEYRLNNVACRLKDITSLFLDTGIGSNSYAIIALDMVDNILNDKENSRLRMFEQAAGISKYKIRKRETLNKLKNTTDDLERVEDLLFEIEQNLKTLEKQARQTKRYFELKEKYKTFSLQLAALRVGRLREKQSQLQQKIDQETDNYRGFEASIGKLEADLEAARKSNLDKEKALTERQRALNNLVGDIRSRENDRNMLRQRQDFIRQGQNRLELQLDSYGSRIAQLEEQVREDQANLKEEKDLEAKMEEGLGRIEKELESIRARHGSAKEGLDEQTRELQEIERGLFELEKQKAVNQNRLENLRQERDQISSADFQRRLEIENLEEKEKSLQDRLKEQKDYLQGLEREEEERKAQLESTEEEAERNEKELSGVNRQLDARRHEFQLTRSMIENLEGFPESIKFLSTQKKWSEKAPLLSDLIYVEEAYRVAIENYLEPFLNHYVVADENAAYEAIRLLNQSQKGKANFFILEAFRDYEAPMALLPGATAAVELVQTDAAYRPLIEFLLERVLVIPDEDVAHAPDAGEFILLSANGHFVKKRHSLGGGSVGLFEGKKIGRKKNLELLEKDIRKLEKKEQQLVDRVAGLRSRIAALKEGYDRRQIDKVREACNLLEQELASLTSRRESLRQVQDASDERVNRFSEEEKRIQVQNANIERELEERTAGMLKRKTEMTDADASYREVSEALTSAAASFNDQNIRFIRQQNKVGSLQKELAFRERQLEELRTNRQKDQAALERGKSDLEVIGQELSGLEAGLKRSYEERKDMESKLSEAEQVFFQARGGIHEIEDKIRKLTKNQQDTQILINNLKDKRNEIVMEVRSVADRLQVEFQVELPDLPQSGDLDGALPESELDVKVERLKNRLTNYGEINPMAVEAYDAMKERYDSITRQRDDILDAKASLLETIKEIEETATSQFLQSFAEARTYFIEVFRSLFTEDDDADLILLEPDNPLESKIEIVAKPKGKRPQTISQLSGGEKTLTATALLFALYLLKPAPFCIFDEVDAPLDDTNIEKFNKIIKKFSERSQFIIVTHNKLTMAAVDTIYGVYMQETGVSAVSPVDFRDYDHRPVMEVAR